MIDKNNAIIGTIYLTDGLNMKCQPVSIKVKLLRFINDNPNWDCVVLSGKIKVMANLRDLRAITGDMPYGC